MCQARSGPDRPPSSGSGTEQHYRHSVGRLLDLPRADAQGRSAACRRPLVLGELLAVEGVDDASDPGATAYETNLPQDVRNMAAERAPSSFDHRHRFVGNFTYVLPRCGRNRVGQRGSARTGRSAGSSRCSPARRSRRARDRPREHRIGPGAASRCDLRSEHRGGAQRRAMVQHELLLAAGGVHVRQFRPQHRVRARLRERRRGLQQEVLVASGLRLQLRWEMFNLLNRANFDVPNRTAFTPNFGRIFSAGRRGRCSSGSKFSSDATPGHASTDRLRGR